MTNPVIDQRSKYPADSVLRKPSTHTRNGRNLAKTHIKSFEEKLHDKLERKQRRKLLQKQAFNALAELSKIKLEFAEFRKKSFSKFDNRPVYKKGMKDDFYKTREWRNLRWEVLEKYGGNCSICGRNNKDHGVIIHIDHIKPRSKYPELELKLDNMQVLCEDCNIGKGAKLQTF